MASLLPPRRQTPDFGSLMLALMRMQENRAAREDRGVAAEALTAARLQKLKEAEQSARERQFGTAVESVFGVPYGGREGEDKTDVSISPYTAAGRRQYELMNEFIPRTEQVTPGASISEKTGLPTLGPLVTATRPGAKAADVVSALMQGKGEMAQEMRRLVQATGAQEASGPRGEPSTPTGLMDLAGAPGMTPAKLQAAVEKGIEIRKKQLDVEKAAEDLRAIPRKQRLEEAQTTKAEVEASILTQTEGAAVQKARAEAARAVAGAEIEEWRSRYAKWDAMNDAKLKELQVKLNEAKIQQQPLEEAKLRADIGRLNEQTLTSQRNRERDITVTGLAERFARESDPNAKLQVGKLMLAASGDVKDLAKMDAEQVLRTAQLKGEAARLFGVIREQSPTVTAGTFPQFAATARAANHAQLAAAQSGGVSTTALIPYVSTGWDGSKVNSREVMAPYWEVNSVLSGRASDVYTGKATLRDQTGNVIDPTSERYKAIQAKSLASAVAIEHAYADPSELPKILDSYAQQQNVDPDVVSAAKLILQQQKEKIELRAPETGGARLGPHRPPERRESERGYEGLYPRGFGRPLME